MKVLSPLLGPGTDPAGPAGSPVHIHAFVRALADLGYQVTVVSQATTSEQAFNGDLGQLVRLARIAAWKCAAARGPRHGRLV